MPDLFSRNLESLKLKDVEDFLGLDSPESRRPVEGPQLDFKRELTEDIGDDVAAMANTFGGLILIGVKSDKTKRNAPTAIQGLEFRHGDLRAHVTNKVITTVHPRPEFDVLPIEAATSNRWIFVIRVRQGSFPPYEYSQGAAVRIPVRVQDTNRQATLREIEGMISRRGAFTKRAGQLLAEYVETPGMSAFNAEFGSRPTQNLQTLFIVPRIRQQIRFDLGVERELDKLAWDPTFEIATPSWMYRRANFLMVANKNSNRVFTYEVWSSGALRFVVTLPDVEAIGNLALYAIHFLRLAHRFFESFEYFGGFAFECVVDAPSVSFRSKFPAPGGLGDYDHVPGVNLPDSAAAHLPKRARFVDDVELSELTECAELVTRVISDILRELANAPIRTEKLFEAIDHLARGMRSQGWGGR